MAFEVTLSTAVKVPPDPGEVPIPNLFLKAANGSRMSCYGHKVMSVRIGQKDYKFRVIKAQVESPIIGWDFMKHHKLDLRWNEEDQITIFDKKDGIASVLELKSIPIEKSIQMKNLSLISLGNPHQNLQSESPEVIMGEVAAMQALNEDEALAEDETIDVVPDSPYKDVLAKFPNLLKQNFHTETTSILGLSK